MSTMAYAGRHSAIAIVAQLKLLLRRGCVLFPWAASRPPEARQVCNKLVLINIFLITPVCIALHTGEWVVLVHHKSMILLL